jgi:hypothetical protein
VADGNLSDENERNPAMRPLNPLLVNVVAWLKGLCKTDNFFDSKKQAQYKSRFSGKSS